MHKWIAVSICALAGCITTHSSSDPSRSTGASGSVSTASLTPQAKAQECPHRDPLAVPDLAGPAEPTVNFPCFVYDADVGGLDTCCGGDLRVQRCAPGLQCIQPDPDSIGYCDLAGNPPAASVCVDTTSPEQAQDDCWVDAIQFDSAHTHCRLLSTCGNSSEELACENGRCACSSYGTELKSFADPGVCAGSFADAEKVAETQCGFPSRYQKGGTTWM